MISSRFVLSFMLAFLALTASTIILTGTKHAKAVKANSKLLIDQQAILEQTIERQHIQDSVTSEVVTKLDSVIIVIEDNLPTNTSNVVRQEVYELKKQVEQLK